MSNFFVRVQPLDLAWTLFKKRNVQSKASSLLEPFAAVALRCVTPASGAWRGGLGRRACCVYRDRGQTKINKRSIARKLKHASRCHLPNTSPCNRLVTPSLSARQPYPTPPLPSSPPLHPWRLSLELLHPPTPPTHPLLPSPSTLPLPSLPPFLYMRRESFGNTYDDRGRKRRRKNTEKEKREKKSVILVKSSTAETAKDCSPLRREKS